MAAARDADSTFADILTAVMARLIAQITEFNSNNCFLTLDPMPFEQAPPSLFCTVCPMEGRFDQAIIEGAGAAACALETGVTITVASTMRLDKAAQHAQMLTQTTRGLLVLQRKVLKALTGYDLTVSGNRVLRNLIAPLQSMAPGYDRKSGLAWIGTAFSLDFDNDLAT